MNPSGPWTEQELDSLSDAELEDVLRRDLRAHPREHADRAALVAQILSQQKSSAPRGTVYRVPGFGEGWLLYEHVTEEQLRRDLDRIESAASWGEVQALVTSGDSAGHLISRCLSEEPMTSWMAEAHGDQVVAGSDPEQPIDGGLTTLLAIPPESPATLRNMLYDGGGFVFANPFDPRNMGVPEIVVRRYCVDQLDCEDRTLVLPDERLADAASTLAALGWELVESPGGRLPLE